VSTILKALRRLEQERSKGAERPLREQVVLSRARRRGPWAVWLATGGALALGFAATWGALTNLGGPLADPEEPAAAVSAPPPDAAAASPGTVSPAPAAPAKASRLAPRPPSPTPDRVGSPPPLAAAPAARVAAVPPPAAASPGSGATAVVPEPAPRVAAPPPRAVAAPPARVAPVPPPPAERTFADEDPVLTAPITGRAPRFVDDVEAPPRAAAAVGAEVPVDVVRTSWHPQGPRRAAWVAVAGESPRQVHEGDWVGAYEVRAIEPDGVLFADGPLLVHRAVGQR
jgi:hypothetical protein